MHQRKNGKKFRCNLKNIDVTGNKFTDAYENWLRNVDRAVMS
jgi:hypothetical protein